ncbi:MAG: hypothetical protein ABR575_04035, partial [Actinomycetota bacterium]
MRAACIAVLVIASLHAAPGPRASAATDRRASVVRVGSNFVLGKDPLPARGRDVIGMSVDPA